MIKTFISICTMLAFASSALAEDTFSVDNVTLPLNGEADVVVRFNLDAGSTCSGYTFWLQVPDELAFVTYEKNSKTYITYTAGDCYDETPTITPNIDGGYLKVGCLTANSDPLNKQNGILVTFRIKANATVSVGDIFTGTLTKSTISAENGQVHDVANTTFTITIGTPADSRTILDETSTAVPESATGVDIRVKRTILANEWSTICLPFAMSETQVKNAFGNDVQLGEFEGTDPEFDAADNVVGIKVNFSNATAIEANHPYIIKVSTSITEFTLDNVDIAADENVAYIEFDNGKSGARRVVYSGFYGTYHAGTVLDKFTLFLSDNKFWYSKGLTKMKAFRAYFDFLDVLTAVEDAYSSRISMSFDNEITGIKNLNYNNNQNDNRFYDLQGRRVVEPGRGIYVKEGKKVIVK